MVICIARTSDRRSGRNTTNHIIIWLSEQVSIPLYRFLYFLEHIRRWGGCTNKNCFSEKILRFSWGAALSRIACNPQYFTSSGRNTSPPIVISTWINVFIPRNRFNYLLAHFSALEALFVRLLRINDFAIWVLTLRLQFANRTPRVYK